MNQTELLSPAGDFETALAAFDAGADAVYCGLADFSARAFAKNLSYEDLGHLVRFAHAKGKKVYVTFNTLVDEVDVEQAVETLSRLEEIGPDALIVQDLGVARLCRRHFPTLALHASTQLVAHNLEGVLALKDVGFTRVVLARELSLAEIASISKRCGGLELECFIHGALCYSISGLCLFGAMEKGRSGNRGKCPYCCRMEVTGNGELVGAPLRGDRTSIYPFSMKDLRLGEDVRKLVVAGVVSLKIEGRMKSSLYVAAVTKFYRQILDSRGGKGVTLADLETIFSRRTTELYLDGKGKESPIDPESLGHLGAPIGTVKRVTKDREGRRWLRFHTARALEVHDGLQFDTMADGRHLGLGIREMRPAISRTPVFEVAAGTDVEIELPEDFPIREGENVYCSMSNAVKRMFPAPSFRPSDYPGNVKIDLEVTIAADSISATANGVTASIPGTFDSAKNPEKTYGAVEKAFSKLGETNYALGKLSLVDPDRRFAPMSVLNDLRRDLVEHLDEDREKTRRAKVEAALADDGVLPEISQGNVSARRLKIRIGQTVPAGEWDEIIVAIDLVGAALRADRGRVGNAPLPIEAFDASTTRLALPVYTAEPDFNKLRVLVKRLHREGFEKWEASDLATLRLLKAAGVSDITADWTLYAFNSHALAELSSLGVKRFVASPENVRENLSYLAESGYDIEFLAQQATPLFVSLTKPAAEQADGLAIYRRDNLWVTTRPVPRTFDAPAGSSVRLDLSWNPPE
ncbi:MAG: U32 family peptidase [Kiritimatiellae bacterium]|nr:U32 family peptidase [Kiritimatiellia bacterium]